MSKRDAFALLRRQQLLIFVLGCLLSGLISLTWLYAEASSSLREQTQRAERAEQAYTHLRSWHVQFAAQVQTHMPNYPEFRRAVFQATGYWIPVHDESAVVHNVRVYLNTVGGVSVQAMWPSQNCHPQQHPPEAVVANGEPRSNFLPAALEMQTATVPEHRIRP